MRDDSYSARNFVHRFVYGEIDDSGEESYGKLDMLTGERFSQVMRVQQHGFSSVPPVGAHGVGVTIGSNRDMLMALGGEMPAKRPKSLGVGNTALYNADGSIWKLVGKDATFDAEGNCTMTVKSLTVNCGGVSMTISADGVAITGGRVTHNGKNIGDTHTHSGVKAGADNTGTPN